MKSSVVAVDKNLKEQISHGNYAFPVDVHSEVFQAEGTGAPSYFVCHWHPESELMIVLSGSMRYQVNETVYDIKEGEGLFINSNCLIWVPQSVNRLPPYLSFSIPVFCTGMRTA